MKYNVISYLIGEGIRNVFKNKKSTISAFTIMCLCMLVFGIFFIVSENINHIMNTVQDAQGMNVYINVGTSEERVKEIGEKIKQIENGISNVEYISSEDGFNSLKEMEKYETGVLEGISADIIPEGYKVTLSDLSLNKEVQQKITEIVGEDLNEIVSSDEVISTLLGIAKGVKIFTFALLLILILISLVIIANTIKLTVHARRKEISIMKYVGATNSFIRWPFIVEGIIIGIVAACIAILIVGLSYNALIPKLLESETVKQLEITFVTFSNMFNSIAVVYMFLGIGIGVLGSSISMRKYLEV